MSLKQTVVEEALPFRSAERVAMRPIQWMESAPCTRPNCRCHGRGSIVLYVSQDASRFMPEFSTEQQTRLCLVPQRTNVLPESASATLLYGGEPIVHLPMPAEGEACWVRLNFDMPAIDPEAFTILPHRSNIEVVGIHHRPHTTLLETHLNQTVPVYISSTPVGTIHTPSPLLLVESGGCVLGGLLAKMALAKLQRSYAATPTFSEGQQPGKSSDSNAKSRLSLFGRTRSERAS